MTGLLMQTKLGRAHDSIKEYGIQGNPIRLAFYKKLRTDRVKEHVDYLFKEAYGDTFESEEQKLLLKDQYKKALQKLRGRGYQII